MSNSQNSKPRLLVVTTTFPRWKNDTDPPFVYELAKRLTNDFEVTIHTPHYPGSLSREKLSGLNVYRFRYFLEKYEKIAGNTAILSFLKGHKAYFAVLPFFMFFQFISLIFLSLKSKPDIIHVHWVIPQGFTVYLVCLLTNVPYVVTAHGADVFGLRNPFFKKVRSLVLKRSAAITAVSKALKDELKQEAGWEKKISVLPMGVDAQRFGLNLQSQKGTPRLLFVGRLTEKKGVIYLINALPEVLKVFPEISLSIVGSGELDNELKRHVDMLDICESVEFVGALPNEKLPDYYAGHTIFISPSIEAIGGDTEGFGLTFVEAAMSGCLLIGTNVGGIKDIIINNVSGYLVEQKNSKAIAERIIYSLQHPLETAEIAKKGRNRCANYDWSIISNEYINLLQSVISN